MLNFALKMEPAKLAAIILGAIFALIVIISIVITVISNRKGEPYDKDAFVHKVMKYDESIFFQLARACMFVLFVGGVVTFFVKFNYHYIVSASCAGALVLVALVMLFVGSKVKNCRIEYNKNALYYFGPFGNRKQIAWKNLKNVQAVGMGRDRKYIFTDNKKTTITVPFKIVGGYEFAVFCENQLDKEQFEEIVIGKARQ